MRLDAERGKDVVLEARLVLFGEDRSLDQLRLPQPFQPLATTRPASLAGCSTCSASTLNSPWCTEHNRLSTYRSAPAKRQAPKTDGHVRRDGADWPPAAAEPPERFSACHEASHPGHNDASGRRRPRELQIERLALPGRAPARSWSRLTTPILAGCFAIVTATGRPMRLRGHAREDGRDRGPSSPYDLF